MLRLTARLQTVGLYKVIANVICEYCDFAGVLKYTLVGQNILDGHSAYINTLTVLPNGDLCCGSYDGIHIWRDGKCFATLTDNVNDVISLAVSSNGDLYSGSLDHTIKIWRDYKCIHTLYTHCVNHLTFLPNGDLCSVSFDRKIKIWRSAKCIKRLRGHSSWINCITSLPNGDLYSGSGNHTIKVWRNGVCVATLTCHTGPILSLTSFGEYVYSGSSDKSIKIFRYMICISTLLGHLDGVNVLSILPNGV